MAGEPTQNAERSVLMQQKVRFTQELMAGTTTFLTMAYIVFVNPQILSTTGMDRQALIVTTCLISGLATIATGWFSNLPLAMAPGMGLNAFFAYTLVAAGHVTWQTALGIVFLSGIFFLLLTLLGFRQKLAEAIPPALLHAVGVGIGLFITFIGLQNLGLVVDNPATLVSAGVLTPKVLQGLAGLILIIVLHHFRIRGALLLGILFVSALSVVFGDTRIPEQLTGLPGNPLALVGQLDIAASLRFGFLGAIFSLMFVDLFDSLGTLLACLGEMGIKDPRVLKQKLNRMLLLDALATMGGALLGTSTTTTYVESAAGIEAGGRTGRTAIVCGLLFLIIIPFVPLLAVVPAHATAPCLIMVGFFMVRSIRHIPFDDLTVGVPAFLIVILIALTYSIATGLAFGFLSFALLKTLSGKIREIDPVFWIIALLSAGFLLFPA